MDPRDPRIERHLKLLENQWQVRPEAQEIFLKNMGIREAVGQRYHEALGFNALRLPGIQQQFSVWPQLKDALSQAHGFAGTVGSWLSRAVRPVVFQAKASPPAPSVSTRMGDAADVAWSLPKSTVFQSFWEGIGRAAEGFLDRMEEARAGAEVLDAAQYGFADHLWSMVYLRSFTDIPAKVRPAVVTKKLAAFTSSEEFVEPLLENLAASRMLGRRSRVVELALEAHVRKEYELSIPPLFAQIEGAVGDAMFLKELVVRVGNSYYLVGPDGKPKVDKRGKRLAAVTLSPALLSAKLEENADLAAASEFLSGVLVQRRNEVMHGRDVAYGRAKLSVQALLVLAVLAESFGELEEE